MAERRPLVILDDNNVAVLPAGDTLPGGGGGGDRNVDGGNAASIYLPSQVVDGGDANG